MSKHIWSVVCQTILTDQFSNTVSYIQAIEGYTVVQLPTVAPPMMLGILWGREGNENAVRTRVRIVAPDQSIALTFEAEPASYGQNVRIRQNIMLGGFVYGQAGNYELVVEHKRLNEWVTATSIPIQVNVSTLEEMLSVQKQRAAAASAT
jgi:hypothetical protein